MTSVANRGRKPPSILASDPITGEVRRFPVISSTYLRRNIRKALILAKRRRVVFITLRGKVSAVMLSRDAWLHSCGSIRHELDLADQVSLGRVEDAPEKAYESPKRGYKSHTASGVIARCRSRSTETHPHMPDVPPPKGYTNWLDYAVDCVDTRSVEIEQLFAGENPPAREAMRMAARIELDCLRALLRTRV